MNWYLSLFTGAPTDIYLLMGIPALIIAALTSVFLILRDIHDLHIWKKYRNERVPRLRERLRRKHKTAN